MPKRTSFDSLYDRRKIGNLTVVNILSEVCNEEAKNIKTFTFLN